MTDNQWGYYPGEDGTATDDETACIGAIDTASELDEDASNATLYAEIPQPSSGSEYYYGGAYRKLAEDATDNAENTRAYNRNGAILNALAGTPRVVSTSPLDVGVLGNAAGTGLQVRLVAKVSSAWTPQYLNINGTSFSSDVAGGVQQVDALWAYRWELCLDGNPVTFYGDVGCFIGMQLVAVIRGTLNPRRGIVGQGNKMATAEVQIAIATAKNSTIACPDGRKVSPTGIGAFDEGVWFAGNGLWTGSDQSLVLPSGPYVPGDYFGFATRFEAIAGITPPLGDMEVDVGLLCRPVAV